MGLHIGAMVLFQDPKQTYEIKGCGLGVCASVCVCKIGCSILKKKNIILRFSVLFKTWVAHNCACLFDFNAVSGNGK